jgi:hypothetical protein
MYQKDLYWTIGLALNIAQVEHLTRATVELDLKGTRGTLHG